MIAFSQTGKEVNRRPTDVLVLISQTLYQEIQAKR
jgi:hypothetical protein